MIESFHHTDFSLPAVLERKVETVSVVLPARNEQETVGQIVCELRTLGELIDQIVVVDADSEDGTARIAREAGAEVYSQSTLMPEFGPVHGKGDAMWRALSVAEGDIVAYLDSDTIGFRSHFALGLVGVLIQRHDLLFAKGAFQRPYIGHGIDVPREGGRVTELCARPALSAFYPPLAGFAQPLAGEVAARRSLLEELPFSTGYAIEIGMLIDVYESHGLGVVAQVDLGERRNTHQSLYDLGPMAYAVLTAVLRRVRRDGRLTDEELLPYRRPDGRLVDVDSPERPPFATVRASARR